MPKEPEPPPGAPLWLCTFSDMMSLLLCFFVLLFALSTIEKKKMIQASGSLRAAFGGLPAPYLIENIPDKRTQPKISRPAQLQRAVSYAKNDLMREEVHKIKELSLQSVMQVTGTEQGITFRISGDALFDPGQATLRSGAILALDYVASELVRFPSNPIKIEGNTDNTFNKNDPDFNWRLGAERAYAVIRQLVDYGSTAGQVEESRFVYESFAQFNPLPDADSETTIGRAMNRRVDITLVQTDEQEGTFFEQPDLKNPRSPIANPNPPPPK